jgi:hypothetical protein
VIADGQLVQVYNNIPRDLYSVRERGLVVDHTDAITLVNARMHVNPKAQARIAAGGPRQVHAWITGWVCQGAVLHRVPRRITYHPHDRPEFYIAHSGEPIHGAPVVVFTPNGVFI